MNRRLATTKILSISAVFIAFLSVSGCSSSTATTTTSTSIDPYSSLDKEVEEFVRSYVTQAVAARPEILNAVSQIDLLSCVTNAVGQIARSAATSIEKTGLEDDVAWYARSRSAALQSAQASIEGVIPSCAQ